VSSADFQSGLDAENKGDYKTALREWLPLAENGDSEVQFILGLMYLKGEEGVPRDFKAARKWWTLAAEQGDPNAQFQLAFMYLNGEGVPRDSKTAIKL